MRSMSKSIGFVAGKFPLTSRGRLGAEASRSCVGYETLDRCIES